MYLTTIRVTLRGTKDPLTAQEYRSIRDRLRRITPAAGQGSRNWTKDGGDLVAYYPSIRADLLVQKVNEVRAVVLGALPNDKVNREVEVCVTGQRGAREHPWSLGTVGGHEAIRMSYAVG